MKEEWKKCPVCKIYIDADEKYCPRYGRHENHKLQIRKLTDLGVKRLYKQKKLLTKHIVTLEERFRK